MHIATQAKAVVRPIFSSEIGGISQGNRAIKGPHKSFSSNSHNIPSGPNLRSVDPDVKLLTNCYQNDNSMLSNC